MLLYCQLCITSCMQIEFICMAHRKNVTFISDATLEEKAGKCIKKEKTCVSVEGGEVAFTFTEKTRCDKKKQTEG